MLGINQSNLCQLGANDLSRVCDDIAAFGFTSVRFSVDWGWLSNFLGSTNYQPVKNVQKALASRGLTPLPVLGVHYPWVHSASAFRKFVSRCVEIFGAIPVYEVWNEPNIPAFNIGGPANYLKYLRAAAPLIRAVGAQVIHAGLAVSASGQGLFGPSWSPSSWLVGMHHAGESGDYDMLGYHPYPLTPTAWDDPADAPFGMAQIDAMDMFKDRPYAFTEVGYDTSKVPVATAATQLTYQLKNLPDAPVWLFCWRDTPGDAGKYGLVDANNVPKQPLYDTVKGLL